MPHRFHLAHMVPDPRLHGLYGYREVIDTFQWGLVELGHTVTYAENVFSKDAINIVFGFQVLADGFLDELPRNTIIYNLEQNPRPGSGIRAKACCNIVARRLQIWDYCERNLDFWRQLSPAHTVRHVPVGWAPVLEKIKSSSSPDIDVLIYGLPAPLRLQIFHDLCKAGVKCVFLCGLYGESRDGLIARAKLVLNINQYGAGRIFEIVRVSYLLANAKPVVADSMPDTWIEPDVGGAVAFASPDALKDKCLSLLQDDSERLRLGKYGQEVIRKRDIRTILSTVLGAMP